MPRKDDGGPAFPIYDSRGRTYQNGVSIRDWFASTLQVDDRLVKVVRAMDDSTLELFALYPEVEREEWLTEADLTNWMNLPDQVSKIARRLELEARAIARVRFMQADAMLVERNK